MPSFQKRPPDYKPQKDVFVSWDGFNGGWNNIFRPTELKPNELAQADNLMLTGEGVVTGRWGSQNYNLAGDGEVRMLIPYYQGSTNELLFITDDGYLRKKSGASYTQITGASWPSASDVDITGFQLGGNVYLTGGGRELIKYDGTNLIPYPTISAPISVTATNISGVSGTNTWSWRITASNLVGETTGSQSLTLGNLPFDLTNTVVRINWGAVSAASGVLRTYNVYRGQQGDEGFVASVDANTTTFLDVGSDVSDTVEPPIANTTGGPKAKYAIKFDDRSVVAGIEGDTSLVMISGRYPYHDRYNWAYGGGYVRVDPDGGDEITGLGISGSQSQGGQTPASILVFKKNSTHQIVLRTVEIGNYVILDPQVQFLAPTGASSHKTICGVENNTFYFGRDGLYTVGQEPNFLNQIRTKELSARIRTYLQGLSDEDRTNAVAAYIDSKYLLSFPTRKEIVIYDMERACFMGPWKLPFGVTELLKYYDTNSVERWLGGTDTGYVKEFSSSLKSDSGVAINKLLRTRREDFDDWTVMKVIKFFHVLFRNVTGSVTVNLRIEGRDGITVTTKSFNITGSTGTSGWGTDEWGTASFGDTADTGTAEAEDIIRYTLLYKTARTIQVEVQTTGANSNFEFLSINMSAQPLQQGSLNSDTRV